MKGKTLNQISKEIKISKNVLYRICKKYGIEGESTNNSVNSPKLYSLDQEQKILEYLGISSSETESEGIYIPREQPEQPEKNYQEEYIRHLEEELSYLKEQIIEKDKQIESLQKQNDSLVRSQAQAIFDSQKLTSEYMKLKEFSERKLSFKERIYGRIALPESSYHSEK